MASRRRNKKPVYEYYYSKHPNPRTVVLGLLNGVDILLVDPLLYPSLIEPLEYYKQRYEETNQPKVAEKIQFWIDYIEKYPERQKMQAILMRKPKPPPEEPKPFTEEECSKHVDDIKENGVTQSYSYEELQQIIAEIRQRRFKLIEKQKFKEANLYDEKLKQLIAASEMKQALDIARNKQTELTEKVKEAQNQLDDITKRWNQVLHNFLEEKKSSLKNLAKEQDEEYKKQAEELQNKKPKTLSMYSSAYLDMRKKEECLISGKKYVEASQMRDEMENEQYNYQMYELQDLWDANTQLLLDQLCKKQDQAYAIKIANLRRDETDLRKAMDAEIKSAQQKLKMFQEMLNKTEMEIQQMDPALNNKNNIENCGKTAQGGRSQLPTIKIPAQSNEHSPNTFRMRALINRKIYTRKPPQTARIGKR